MDGENVQPGLASETVEEVVLETAVAAVVAGTAGADEGASLRLSHRGRERSHEVLADEWVLK